MLTTFSVILVAYFYTMCVKTVEYIVGSIDCHLAASEYFTWLSADGHLMGIYQSMY